MKPLLVIAVTGQERTLEIPDITLLAQWVCLKTMISEHADSELASTPAADRRAFYEARAIPGYYRIYLGAQSTQSVTWLYRHSSTISLSSTVQPPLLDGLSRNVQTVTFILGRLVFHVLAARVSGFELDRDLCYPGLQKIWPMPPSPVSTAELRALDSSQLALVRESFETYLAYQRPRFVDNVI
ncbi:hypothetical protein LU699_08705 [Luteimonas fraxinea]|uniref:Uncharacterized protein n=1 Tax=Luteimonas fraxinea TaxID=2901869 RepID=A0ABS8UFJ3_9GAMM|nr:hypothetical protein [Luteimonas fraxinea]MCD9097511.1 hypothetical protein [Luteimonas fraxinea]UHH11761.1 hypothetical protein LU699_08705 [Luteimonas fraxinea]